MLGLVLGAVPAVWAQQGAAPHTAAQPSTVEKSGRIVGRVIDRKTGRPLSGARIAVVGRTENMASDMDGRFRSPQLPLGVYSVLATLIGYQALQVDSIKVTDGASVAVNLALQDAPVELQDLVSSAPPQRASADAGLLAARQAASAMTDGVSAEAISKAPDADAADAATRVTGLSIFDDKYVVVRGLGERYSNAQLNGADVASPVLEKKVIPLDIFPASFLESIVASKTATPDKPGDFAGGSVEIRTKDFPENRIRQLTLSRAYNSLATLREMPMPPRGGTDWLGIDGGRREPPATGATTEQGLEAFRNIWIPGERRAPLGLGTELALGDQFPIGGDGLGYIFSLNYGTDRGYIPRSISLPSSLHTNETKATVDWGGIFNVTYRIGSTAKFGIKNLYTRAAEETYREAEYETQFPTRAFQLHYLERYLWQSQLTGDHQLGFILGSRFEWKLTYSRANINEPDNHTAFYALADDGKFHFDPTAAATRLNRALHDKTRSGQADWSVPIAFRRPGDAQLKLGASYRVKIRDYDANDFRFLLSPNASTYGIDTLSPERAFAPENLGNFVTLVGSGQAFLDPYGADDKLFSTYAMLDIPLSDHLRFVGGVRREAWRLKFLPGGRNNLLGLFRTNDSIVTRNNDDYLPSGNLTIKIGDRMNIRLAGSRTLARPDSRELSDGVYAPVAGDCAIKGNSSIERSLITNLDARWELYPREGEIASISGFHKYLKQPIIETVPNSADGCFNSVANGNHATVSGMEFEIRHRLDFLPGVLRGFAAGLNLTLVSSSIDMPQSLGTYGPLELVGQSPLLVNVNVAYEPPGSPLSFSMLYNHLGDRIYQYGATTGAGATGTQSPNRLERGRGTLDAKARWMFTQRLKFSVSGKNLTDSRTQIVIDDPVQRRISKIEASGIKVSASISYEF